MFNIIESANAIIAGFLVAQKINIEEEVKEEEEDSLYFSPDKNNVAFCSAIDNWSFIPSQFSDLYATKLGVKSEVFTKCLWGNYYFNAKQKKVSKTPPGPTSLPMFVQFVLEPIWKIYDQVHNVKDYDALRKMLSAINVTVGKLNGEARQDIITVMSTWLPIDKSIMALITTQLPSPVTAQKDRVDTISPLLASSPFY
jgi:ribosome assembly protein 1